MSKLIFPCDSPNLTPEFSRISPESFARESINNRINSTVNIHEQKCNRSQEFVRLTVNVKGRTEMYTQFTNMIWEIENGKGYDYSQEHPKNFAPFLSADLREPSSTIRVGN